jgi:phospholipase C
MRRSFVRSVSLGLAVFVVFVVSCSSGPGAPRETAHSPAASARTTAPVVGHVFLIVFENHSYDQIIGNADAPYLNALARRYGLATNYHAVAHPSLPNYLALVGGSTFGIADDCTSCRVSASNLADQLEKAGLSWKGYMEGMPAPCYRGASAGRYAKKHNPFAYFADIAGDAARCPAHVVPLGRLSADLASGSAPRFSFVTPDLCHDMHDCSVSTGDRWLRSFLPSILRDRSYRRDGAVFLTFDEGDANNHVATIVITPPGIARRSSAHFDHYSLLRTIEDVFGLAHLRHAGDAGRRSLSTLLS